MKIINNKLLLFIVGAVLCSSVSFAGLESLPVQDGGRIKPFDTFSREMLSLLHGKESYNRKSSNEIVLSWLLVPQEWEETPFVLLRHSGLREAMNLDNKRLYYSVKELMLNDRLGLLIQELKNKREAQEKLDPFDQAVQTLENQISAFQSIKLGLGLRIMPKIGDAHTWSNLTDLQGDSQEKFKNITASFIKVAQATAQNDQAAEKSARAELDASVQSFIDSVNSQFGDYANSYKIKAEVHYNNFHPFRWAWVLYLLALVFFSFAYFGTKTTYMRTGWLFLYGGFAFHLWGFALRVYILERAPVTNMFETVVWVAMVALVFAKILYLFSKAKILPVAAAMVSTLALILCDVSSSVLDDSLIPLEPVLRDNFWLLTHVVIIVSSYAAFFLAFFIGDVMLYYFMKDEKKYSENIASGTMAIYRCMQIGVVLLAAGVILGGIWADYSWGRFWGWDPKETWAFIALLGYIAILHGRLVGWLRNFGLAASAVISFSLVIMAWYGVNFVLGAGLHTYGFGAGGVEYVSAFVALHLLYVAYVSTLRQSRLKASKT